MTRATLRAILTATMLRRSILITCVSVALLAATLWSLRPSRAVPPAASAEACSPEEVAPSAAPAANASQDGGVTFDFEPNCGQFDPAVRFASRGRGYTLFLTDAEAVFSFDADRHTEPEATRSVVRLTLEGASPRRPRAQDRLTGVVNYLIGSDPTKWRTGIPTYARVGYGAVSPGVDLVYYSRNGVHEYDIVVAPGTDPSRIAMRVDGANRMELDSAGNLQVITDAGSLTMRTPVVYQIVDGQQRPVAARYALGRSGAVGFELGPTDPAAPVVIDPQIVFGTFLGGAGDQVDLALAVDVDAAGNAYVVGSTDNRDFPTQGPQLSRPENPSNGFITKLSPDGLMVYSTYFGGSGSDGAGDVAVRADGVAYVLGDTTSGDLPIRGGFQPENGGSSDLFLIELRADGTAITNGTYFGGSSEDSSAGLQLSSATDPVPANNVLGDTIFVHGATTSPNFPTLGSPHTTRAGIRDAFVTVFERTTLKPVFSTYAGLGGEERPTALIIDRARGFLYLPISLQNPPEGDNALRVIHFEPTVPTAALAIPPVTFTPTPAPGERRIKFTGWKVSHGFLIQTGIDLKSALAVEVNTGRRVTTQAEPFLPIQLQEASFAFVSTGCLPVAPATTCNERAVLTLFDRQLKYISHTNFGGTRRGRSFIITGSAVDDRGNLHFIGTTSDDALPVQNPVQAGYGGSAEGFILTLNPLTGDTHFYSYLGGTSFDTLTDIAVDSQGNRWIVGSTQSPNFPVTRSGVQPDIRGRIDGFVVKIQP